ncbi:hypothetical protein JKP88DRAFT_286122 [Tribonema minus]|uniref:Uncharacterized protein n=1 Tax=Tribonema minus TaxID=303371 RepID=A0A836CLX0_9STRA|nr:hypothetical protein JKP88DRAFT_286122 [Tribonema minus]
METDELQHGFKYAIDRKSILYLYAPQLDYSDAPHGFKCAIDPKSMLYLYGPELDYSGALIGGGFQFQNN